MHAVRESLLEIQAAAAGLPLVKVPIPSPCSNEVYEHAMSKAMTQARAEGVLHVIFGDLFLADIRSYREKQLSRCGMTPVFPLWGGRHARARRRYGCGWAVGVSDVR